MAKENWRNKQLTCYYLTLDGIKGILDIDVLTEMEGSRCREYFRDVLLMLRVKSFAVSIPQVSDHFAIYVETPYYQEIDLYDVSSGIIEKIAGHEVTMTLGKTHFVVPIPIVSMLYTYKSLN